MKLQAALDFFTLDEAVKLMEIISPYVDIAEIGSPLIYAEGFRAVRTIKEKYPELKVLADMKIVDGGYDIANEAYKAGADIVTSIGLTNEETLKGLLDAAKQNNGEAMVDTIGIMDLKNRVLELDEMGFDYILLHTAHDTLGTSRAPVDELKNIKPFVKKAKLGISGGINVSMMPEICEAEPDWVVVGSGITLAKDPLEVVQNLKKYIHQ